MDAAAPLFLVKVHVASPDVHLRWERSSDGWHLSRILSEGEEASRSLTRPSVGFRGSPRAVHLTSRSVLS